LDKKSLLIACMLVVVFVLGGYDVIMALATSQEQAFDQLSYDANNTNTSYANNNSLGTTDTYQPQTTSTTTRTTNTGNGSTTTDNTDDETEGNTDGTDDETTTETGDTDETGTPQ